MSDDVQASDRVANEAATTEEELAVDTHRELIQKTVRELGGTTEYSDEDVLSMDRSRIEAERRAQEDQAFEVEEAEVVYSTD